MPLPAALRARLEKRGLLPSITISNAVEEVIAEDYGSVTNDQSGKCLDFFLK